ncbi:MAG: hypothetical protein V1898_01390 [Patescibacteria group bacterium]
MLNRVNISHLLITPPDNDHNTTGVFISEPTPLEEKNFGRVFSVIDIDSKDMANKEVMELINEELTQNYYRSPDLDIELALEGALNILNRKLQKVISELGEEWAKKVNATVAIIKDGQLHFSQIGNINVLLIQKNKIIKLSDNHYSAPNLLKLFSNLSSGELTTGASVFFGTESLLDYLSQEKIKKTLTDYNPDEAGNYIKRLLEENGNSTNFAAIIIKMVPLTANASVSRPLSEKINRSDELSDDTEDATVKKDSMSYLVNKEAVTDELLSPSLWNTFKKSAVRIIDNIKPFKSKSAEIIDSSSIKEVLDEPILSSSRPTTLAGRIFKIILSILKKTGLYILSGLAWLLNKFMGLFKQRKAYSSSFQNLPHRATGKVANCVNWFKNLSWPRKLFIALFIIIIFIFSQSIINQGKKQETRQEQQQYTETINTIGNKLGEADSKIIMNDFTGARNLATEVKSLMDSIPKDSDTWTANGAEQEQKLQAILDKVNFIVRLDAPTTAADFSSISADLNIDKFSLISNSFFAFSSANNGVYRYDGNEQTASITLNSTGSNKITAISKDSAATILTVDSEQKFYQYNPVLEKLSDVNIDFANQDVNIKDFKLFGTRLYCLDTKNKQIFKNQKDGDNYATGEAWLKNTDVDLSSGLSLAIDGAVYVLQNTGEVVRLYSGNVDSEWKLDSLEPALSGATKIFTDDNTSNLYILDPAQKRVVVFNKNGKLVEQYISNEWSNLKDFYINESDGKAYVLSGAKVYSFDLN